MPRHVLSREEYLDLKRRLWVAQDGKCADCGSPFGLALHHDKGRGIAGGYRDDLDEKNRLLCDECHRKADRKRNSKFGS